MATFDLMVKQGMEVFDQPRTLEALKDLSSRIKTGRHHISDEDRRNNINLCQGLIKPYFKKASSVERSSGTLAIDLENHLRRSRTEAPRFEFKQGLYSLDARREFREDVLEKMLQTIAAISNLGKEQFGFLFTGVTDKEADTLRVEELDGLANVPRIGEFGVVGLEREAK